MYASEYVHISLVPRLSATAYFTSCEKKLGREPGNEAMCTLGSYTVAIIMGGTL